MSIKSKNKIKISEKIHRNQNYTVLMHLLANVLLYLLCLNLWISLNRFVKFNDFRVNHLPDFFEFRCCFIMLNKR